MNVWADPGQANPLAVKVGMTLMVPEIGAEVKFWAANPRLPEPEAPRPIEVLVLVHAYVTPFAMLEVKLNAALLPWQKLPEAGAFMTGFGFTVNWVLTGAPGQACPLVVRDGVAEIVPEIGAVPLLVAVNTGMFPLPEAAKPMEAFVLVHVNTEPAGVAVKFTPVLLLVAQRIWGVNAVATGVGSTVI